MSAVYVGLPVMLHWRRFHFDKGRRWNAVEHLILQALAQNPKTAGQLAVDADLPRRVVLEVLIRLMRAGWVELRAGLRDVTFHATSRGAAVASQDDLPAVTERMARRMSFAVDFVTGSVFRRRELTLLRPDEWQKRTEGYKAVTLSRPEVLPHDLGHIATLLASLFNADEQLVRVDVSDWPPVERLALFSVRDGHVEGLPQRADPALSQALLARANQALDLKMQVPSVSQPSTRTTHTHSIRPERATDFRRDDLILGGEAHEAHVTAVLKKARRHVVIHSTFLDLARFENLLPAMRVAVGRGCRLDILWGQSSIEGGVVRSLSQSEAIQRRLQDAGLAGSIVVHRSSTRSHSKFLVADDGADGTVATVGSCNWLSSGFEAFEASIRLRDPRLVGDLLFEAAELARPQDAQIPEITARLSQSARELHSKPAINGPDRVRILIGQEHDDRVLEARDHAQHRIVVLSHRLGVVAKPAILIPLGTAAKQRHVKVDLYYGKPSGPVEHKHAADTKWKFHSEGVDLVAVHRPKIHAKMLLWDDNCAVITSLNWLSADTSTGNPRQEIGVGLNSSRIAAFAIEEFDRLRAFA